MKRRINQKFRDSVSDQGQGISSLETSTKSEILSPYPSKRAEQHVDLVLFKSSIPGGAAHSKTLGALPGTAGGENGPEWFFFAVVFVFVIMLILAWRLVLRYAPTVKWGADRKPELVPSIKIESPPAVYTPRKLKTIKTMRNRLVIARFNYDPKLQDEIPIRIGDLIFIDYICDDDWAVGWNHSIQQKGAFPFACL
jgi:hypothetical protein